MSKIKLFSVVLAVFAILFPVFGKELASTPGSLIVLLGWSKDAPLASLAELLKGRPALVYCQSPDPAEVLAMRKAAAAQGLLGREIFVEQGDYSTIHLADNLADRIQVAPSANDKTAKMELLRVLCPGGEAFASDKSLVKKTLPQGIDDWTHPFHGPDNNPVSRDQLARAPYLTQFIAEPKFSPMPEVTVACAGRIFKACGNLAMAANENAVLNTLLCINGFNGTILWTRPLSEGFLIHRNTMIATPDTLYLGDDKSCKLINTADGQVKSEIVVPDGQADGKVWKWMGLEKGTLCALVGGDEVRPPTVPSESKNIGHWSWEKWPGYEYKPDSKTNTSFGRTIMAFDAATGKQLWSHSEEEYLDGRAVCEKNGRIYAYSPQKFLICMEAATGKVLWKNSDPELLKAIGVEVPAQTFTHGFSTTAYIKCNDQYIFFAGPPQPNLVVLSAADGKVVWQMTGWGNHHLLLLDDALYAVGGERPGKMEYATGKELMQLSTRGNCTKATASVDALFYRSPYEGTLRYDLATSTPQHIAAMRPPCQDGVIIANGFLYWGPWMCSCPLSLLGHICLGPAGKFNFHPAADEASRLTVAANPGKVATVQADAGDWPCLRADNWRTDVTTADLSIPRAPAWTFTPPAACKPTAPIAVNGLVIYGDYGGAVRALDVATGKLNWETFTAGAIFYPPAYWNGRVYCGSADGRVYALDSATGRELWHYRLAPAERWIPVLGQLMSTWPVAGGLVVENGVVYAAAGISNYDGTYVAALDAVTGKPKWYNDTSGELGPTVKNGISLQGPLLVQNGQLQFAGGNYETAAYDLQTGKCLTPVQDKIHQSFRTVFHPYYPEYSQNTAILREYPDGRILLYDDTFERKWSNMYAHSPNLVMLAAGKPDTKVLSQPAQWLTQTRDSIWSTGCKYLAFAISQNVMLAVGQRQDAPNAPLVLVSLKIQDGKEIWSQEISGALVRDGLAMDAAGRIFLTLQDGRVLCLIPKDKVKP